ncbi:MAG: hypothetical protein HYU88_08070 [Chloroflexi bacterium]|nr:hypothetical protein [Chloroflexota bacterium]MBI4504544.1 hypothetical protein [Chloroflexota bacterium]
MTLALRLSTYLTFVVGLAMFAGWLARAEPITTAHLILGLVVALLALVAVPRGPGPRRAVRAVARVWPLLTTAVGLTIFWKVSPPVVVMVHALMGIAAVALLELALGRRARPAP